MTPLTNCICSKGRYFVAMVFVTICFLLCANSLTAATLYSTSLFPNFFQYSLVLLKRVIEKIKLICYTLLLIEDLYKFCKFVLFLMLYFPSGFCTAVFCYILFQQYTTCLQYRNHFLQKKSSTRIYFIFKRYT